jgi:hypothetical protein
VAVAPVQHRYAPIVTVLLTVATLADFARATHYPAKMPSADGAARGMECHSQIGHTALLAVAVFATPGATLPHDYNDTGTDRLHEVRRPCIVALERWLYAS